MRSGLPATGPLGKGSIYPWAPPAEQEQCLGFADYLGGDPRHQPCGPQLFSHQSPRGRGREANPSSALASTRWSVWDLPSCGPYRGQHG